MCRFRIISDESTLTPRPWIASVIRVMSLLFVPTTSTSIFRRPVNILAPVQDVHSPESPERRTRLRCAHELSAGLAYSSTTVWVSDTDQWRDRAFPSETLLLRTDCPTVALREVWLGRLEHPYPPVAPDCHEVVGVSKLDCAGALP